ncbi:MAG: UDP-3-O-(3-hydroxymyristoyl)glucosamine N-acyltransferase [Firmicutes bacterium]|nr:UDP-3-O-(3-hydroxymyristoyl)glucosamine N-acyltransferase [Bacillota bacterium]
MPLLKDLAKLVSGEVIGDGNIEIKGIKGLDSVGPGEITMAATARVLGTALQSKAAAVIVPANVGESSKPAIRVPNPRLAFAQLLAFFNPPRVCKPGIHPTAVIGENFNGAGAEIGPLVFIGNDVTIGEGAIIYPGAIIEDRVQIGAKSVIHSNVVIREDCLIGNSVQIHAGTVIGADGFGYVTENGKHYKVPQVGKVIIEDDVEIGANVTIDRATTGVTRVRRGAKIDNLVQVGHNVEIGEDNIIISLVGIAGSTKLGDRVIMAGKSSAVGHIQLGNDSVVAANSMVINSLPPNSYVSGIPARPHAQDMRIQAAAGRLPELLKDFRELQKKVADLEKRVCP